MVSSMVSVLPSSCCNCNKGLLRLSTRAWHDGFDVIAALRSQRQDSDVHLRPDSVTESDPALFCFAFTDESARFCMRELIKRHTVRDYWAIRSSFGVRLPKISRETVWAPHGVEGSGPSTREDWIEEYLESISCPMVEDLDSYTFYDGSGAASPQNTAARASDSRQEADIWHSISWIFV